VLALLELLQSGDQSTVSALAARLGVDERTVRRYAAHLTDLGIPVRAQRGRYGGYRLAPGYKLPPLMLTHEEAAAVVLGLVAGRRAGLVGPQPTAADSALAKVRRVLPTALARRLDALLSTMDFTTPARPGAPLDAQVLLTLADAARQLRTVSLSYTSFAGRASERDLDPYGLTFHGGRWYATGFDHSTGQVRTFRLDRIGMARQTSRRFDAPQDFDPTAHVLSGLASVPYPHEVSVVLDADPAVVRRRVPATLGTITDAGGSARLVTRVERLDGMALLLAGLGWRFTVERPDELRTEVRALATRLAADAG
jgi:predicted DNA-binding transcriptional regulator YafY